MERTKHRRAKKKRPEASEKNTPRACRKDKEKAGAEARVVVLFLGRHEKGVSVFKEESQRGSNAVGRGRRWGGDVHSEENGRANPSARGYELLKLLHTWSVHI